LNIIQSSSIYNWKDNQELQKNFPETKSQKLKKKNYISYTTTSYTHVVKLVSVCIMYNNIIFSFFILGGKWK